MKGVESGILVACQPYDHAMVTAILASCRQHANGLVENLWITRHLFAIAARERMF